MKFSLVPNWKDAWRWLSMQFLALAALWESIPEDVKASVVAPDWQNRITFALIVLAGLGRLKDQGTAK
jgi:hypothetical protein